MSEGAPGTRMHGIRLTRADADRLGSLHEAENTVARHGGQLKIEATVAPKPSNGTFVEPPIYEREARALPRRLGANGTFSSAGTLGEQRPIQDSSDPPAFVHAQSKERDVERCVASPHWGQARRADRTIDATSGVVLPAPGPVERQAGE